MKRTMLAVLAVTLISAGCSGNKELIAQKDAELAALASEKARLEADVAEQNRITADLHTRLADLEEQNKVLVRQKDDLTHITLDGAATFATAQADLTSDGTAVIDRVWSALQQYGDRRILVEGHTDNRPIAPSFRWKYPTNWELSSARAHAVLHYLESTHQAEPGRLAAVGYADTEPVADNTTAEGRAQNRRVVITVGSAGAVQQRIAHLETDPWAGETPNR